MKIFISGGCKNGKSSHGERFAAAMASEGLPLYYIATMEPCDDEDLLRVRRHKNQRAGLGFVTVEQPRDILEIIEICRLPAVFLIDSATALLANEMFGERPAPKAHEKVAREFALLLERLENVVVVSDYIYSDSNMYNEATDNYRRGLAHVDRALAQCCDVVMEVVCGIPAVYKGLEVFRCSGLL